MKLLFIFLTGILVTSFQESEIKTPSFENQGENFSNSGYIKLSWTLDGLDDHSFEVQQSEDQEFADPKTIYEGMDLATFISGLANGKYYYRIRAFRDGNYSGWSSPILVEVDHHNIRLALSLAGIGLVVFMITAIIVIRGAKKVED